MLGGGIAAVLLSAALLISRRGVAQRSLDGIIGALGAWTIVASLVFEAAPSRGWASCPASRSSPWSWSTLTLHELFTERVVHSIEVHAPAHEHELAGAGA